MSTYCLGASIARFQAAFMVDTFTVQAMSLASDGSGGQVETWADQTTGVPGFMEQSKYRSDETLEGAHQQEKRRWDISLAQGTVVDASKRLKQTHSNGTAITPRYFKILYVIDGETFDLEVSIGAVETPNIS